MKKCEVAIIGSGPAGWTAGIYVVRSGLKVVIVEGGQPGGQLTTTTVVENFPGFPGGIMGGELMSKIKKQAEELGVEVRTGLVNKIGKTKNGFEVMIDSREKIEARAVIIASGAAARWLDVPGERELAGRGVSGCATCDGPFFRNKEVAVIGGGDSAVEEAVFLTNFAKKVTLIHRRDELRAKAAEQKRLFANPKIEVKWNREVKEFLGEDKLRAIKLFDNKNKKEEELGVDGVFVAIGRVPATDFLIGFVELEEGGYIKTGREVYETMTSVPGVFGAGDCADRIFQQAIVAAGTGCKAAMEAERWLRSQA